MESALRGWLDKQQLRTCCKPTRGSISLWRRIFEGKGEVGGGGGGGDTTNRVSGLYLEKGLFEGKGRGGQGHTSKRVS
jgi:hypothetical protein